MNLIKFKYVFVLTLLFYGLISGIHAQDMIQKVIIQSNDGMRFDLDEIQVHAGATIELTLVHTGKRTKEEMGHNFVLLNKEVEIRPFAMSVLDEKENGYVPESKEDIIVFTDVIGGGESTTITFEAPPKGIYNFLCSVPGHFGLMQGKFIVE
ncbi:MAG: cupredoxin domain-containing protein [Balneola sp.]|nr:cupredoxin domain-containing protein [Balneola sp.]MBO6652237.1 cupredoxin domain-containing protein [Balneola sp.]MBO6710880.1 cupredoxin domain-containing protein [Balneola sp.]MBO6799567.1 cupredoxin domain-containing protein [Balneola sp.]MBO6870299.1 cupredoxin domain-containing protein [Balneola sp.]